MMGVLLQPFDLQSHSVFHSGLQTRECFFFDITINLYGQQHLYNSQSPSTIISLLILPISPTSTDSTKPHHLLIPPSPSCSTAQHAISLLPSLPLFFYINIVFSFILPLVLPSLPLPFVEISLTVHHDFGFNTHLTAGGKGKNYLEY